MNAKIVLLPGDGIGPEVVAQAERVLRRVAERFQHAFQFVTCPIGGCAIDECGDPLPERTLAECRSSQAVLLGAVGGPKWDDPRAKTRPETGLLKIRKALGLFANLRPITAHPQLIDAFIDRYAAFPSDSLITFSQAMINRPDRTAVLRQFHGPVLFIIGEEDTVIPVQDTLRQSHLPAVSHIHLVKNTGHEGMHEAPDTCNDILRDFINFVQQT